MLHCAVLLCKRGSQQLCGCAIKHVRICRSQNPCNDLTPKHSSSIQDQMHGRQLTAAWATQAHSSFVSVQLHSSFVSVQLHL